MDDDDDDTSKTGSKKNTKKGPVEVDAFLAQWLAEHDKEQQEKTVKVRTSNQEEFQRAQMVKQQELIDLREQLSQRDEQIMHLKEELHGLLDHTSHDVEKFNQVLEKKRKQVQLLWDELV